MKSKVQRIILNAQLAASRWAFVGSSLAVFISRSPTVQVIVQQVPKICRVLPSLPGWLFPSIAGLGAYNSLSGATGLQYSPSVSNKTVQSEVGTPLNQTVWIFSQAHGIAQSYTISGSVPPGITPQPGYVPNASVLTFTGTPTTPGTYNITLRGWDNSTRASGDSAIETFTILVTGSAVPLPSIDSHPSNLTVNWGQQAQFSSTASNAASLQWQANGLDIPNGNGISGATTGTLTIANVVAADSGTQYRLVATGSNASDTATSNAATLTVSVTDFEVWRESNFTGTDRFNDLVSGPNADSDGDAIPNTLEFIYNLDPTANAQPSVQLAIVDNGGTLQVTIPRNPALDSTSIVFEQTDNLQNGWNSIAPENIDSSNSSVWVISLPIASAPTTMVRLQATAAESP